MPRIHWIRIVLTAFLLEIAITAVVLPFALLYGDPIRPPAGGPPPNNTPYFVAAAAGCAVLGFLFGRWTAHAAGSRQALHGLLVGVAATVIYFGLCSLAPGGISAVITAYSPALYALFNVLRVAGCWAGGASAGTAGAANLTAR
jgi:hypothetical protein